jgi:hypothetical protein
MAPRERGSEAARRFTEIIDRGGANWPPPGTGRTRARFAALSQIAADSLSVARLVEAHADAAAICAEADRSDLAEGALGVWASDGPGSRLEAIPVARGWHLTGTKRFCSGSTIVERALVTAHAPDGLRLFMLTPRRGGIRAETGEWVTVALAATATGTVHIDVTVTEEHAVGAPGFYLSRPGFWHGAVGVAACWAGGARGLVERYASRHRRDDAHAVASLGAVASACWMMDAALERAAAEIDGNPAGGGRDAMCRALTVRHLVERGCQDVLQRLARAAGPRATAFDAWFAQQSADLALYLQQCHGERDLESLGRSILGRPGPAR